LTIALATSATSASAGAWEAVSLAASTNCGEVRSCDSRVRSVSAGRRRRNEPIWVNSPEMHQAPDEPSLICSN
jgi:hypothetical protein